MIPDVSIQVEKNQEAVVQKKKKHVRSFAIGDAVYVRDFSAKNTQWPLGERSIGEKKGTNSKETFLTTPYSPSTPPLSPPLFPLPFPSLPPPPAPPPPRWSTHSQYCSSSDDNFTISCLSLKSC
uniref:DUF5641 domain-containing protein n=1 Tax=Amphimedon queenslandica TaxID=400682 RepID=A0A1X7TGK1_AMPQE